MFTTLSRTPRRTAAFGAGGAVLLLLGMLMLKDLNEKLSVMTASNSAYQRMTDNQSDKIKQLQASLKDEQAALRRSSKRCSDLEEETGKQRDSDSKRFKKLQDEMRVLQEEYDHMQREMSQLSEANVDTSHKMSRMEVETNKCNAELGRLQMEADHVNNQLQQIMQEAATYKSQYSALFKQHQSNTDSLEELRKDKERLQIQLNDARQANNVQVPQSSSMRSGKKVLHQPEAAKAPPMMSSSTSRGPKVPIPHNNNNMQQMPQPRQQLVPRAPSSSTQRSAVNPQLSLEEPLNGANNNHGLPVSSSTPGSAVIHGRVAAPVAAEPPLGRGYIHGNHEHVAEHEVQREDVMEAPKYGHHPQQQMGHHQMMQHDFNNYLHQQQQQLQQQQEQDHPVYAQHMPQQHHFAMPNGVRFQRRESGDSAPGGGGGDDNLDRQVDPVQQDRPGLGQIPGPGEAAGVREEDADDETDGELKLYGVDESAPIARHEHNENEDDDVVDADDGDIADDDLVYNSLHGLGNNAREDRLRPQNFGINHVNFEPNQLRRFVRRPARYAASGFEDSGQLWQREMM